MREVPKTGLTEREALIEQVTRAAKNRIIKMYGYGNKDGDGLHHKPYHNFLNTKDLVISVKEIATMAGLTDREIDLVEIAAYFRHAVQLSEIKVSRWESAKMAAGNMGKSGAYKKSEIERVKNMVLMPTPNFQYGSVEQPEVEDYLCKIISDADLAYLGQDPEIYQKKVERIIKEMSKEKEEGSERKRGELLGAQDNLLRTYKFYTEEATKLFPHRNKNTELNQKLWEHATCLAF